MLLQKKILIVDDEVDHLDVTAFRIERAGYKVLKALNGMDALKIVDADNPDLVLLDIMMPGMSGIEAAKRIKENKFMTHLPIVFFTAKDSVDDKVEGLKLANDYITKPVDGRELLAKIESILNTQERYKEMSFRDELTGLYNYNYFQLQLEQSFNVARRHDKVFSLLILDIDDFKKINDTYGHLCGNLVLEKMGNTLKNSLRKTDIVARYGGDEFAILLPENNAEQAHVVLNKLRDKINDISIDCTGNSIKVQASFGLSTFSQDIADKEMLFSIADKGLYLDKNKI